MCLSAYILYVCVCILLEMVVLFAVLYGTLVLLFLQKASSSECYNMIVGDVLVK